MPLTNQQALVPDTYSGTFLKLRTGNENRSWSFASSRMVSEKVPVVETYPR